MSEREVLGTAKCRRCGQTSKATARSESGCAADASGKHLWDADTSNRGDGQQKGYVVLSDAEIAKGFVRPVRRAYKHVGRRPKHPTRELTADERQRYNENSSDPFVLVEVYPPEMAPRTSRLWTGTEFHSGCGTTTTMGLALCETYARKPDFYSGTFCATCREHFPVGADGEFVWVEDGERVGT